MVQFDSVGFGSDLVFDLYLVHQIVNYTTATKKKQIRWCPTLIHSRQIQTYVHNLVLSLIIYLFSFLGSCCAVNWSKANTLSISPHFSCIIFMLLYLSFHLIYFPNEWKFATKFFDISILMDQALCLIKIAGSYMAPSTSY